MVPVALFLAGRQLAPSGVVAQKWETLYLYSSFFIIFVIVIHIAVIPFIIVLIVNAIPNIILILWSYIRRIGHPFVSTISS